MSAFLFNVILFFAIYQLGRFSVKKHNEKDLISITSKTILLYDRVMKLAELKGEDTSKLGDAEITRRINKFEQDTQDIDNTGIDF